MTREQYQYEDKNHVKLNGYQIEIQYQVMLVIGKVCWYLAYILFLASKCNSLRCESYPSLMKILDYIK